METKENQWEDERKVCDEVIEKLSQRIEELSDKNNNLQKQIKEQSGLAAELQNEIDQLHEEKRSLEINLETEKRTSQGRIDQILHLNEEIISTIEEKDKLQERISFLEQEILRLEEGMKDPKNYYREEMQKVFFHLVGMLMCR